MNKYLKVKQCDDALDAISRLSQASDYLLGNLLDVIEEFPEESLAGSPGSIFYTRRFDVLGGTVSKEYHEGARPTYKMCWQLDDTSWRTLAEALTTLDPEYSERENLMEYFGEFHIHIVAEPADEYTRLSFDYEGHEFMCLMPRKQAERLGYIEPEPGPEQMVIEGV